MRQSSGPSLTGNVTGVSALAAEAALVVRPTASGNLTSDDELSLSFSSSSCGDGGSVMTATVHCAHSTLSAASAIMQRESDHVPFLLMGISEWPAWEADSRICIEDANVSRRIEMVTTYPPHPSDPLNATFLDAALPLGVCVGGVVVRSAVPITREDEALGAIRKALASKCGVYRFRIATYDEVEQASPTICGAEPCPPSCLGVRGDGCRQDDLNSDDEDGVDFVETSDERRLRQAQGNPSEEDRYTMIAVVAGGRKGLSVVMFAAVRCLCMAADEQDDAAVLDTDDEIVLIPVSIEKFGEDHEWLPAYVSIAMPIPLGVRSEEARVFVDDFVTGMREATLAGSLMVVVDGEVERGKGEASNGAGRCAISMSNVKDQQVTELCEEVTGHNFGRSRWATEDDTGSVCLMVRPSSPQYSRQVDALACDVLKFPCFIPLEKTGRMTPSVETMLMQLWDRVQLGIGAMLGEVAMWSAVPFELHTFVVDHGAAPFVVVLPTPMGQVAAVHCTDYRLICMCLAMWVRVEASVNMSLCKAFVRQDLARRDLWGRGHMTVETLVSDGEDGELMALGSGNISEDSDNSHEGDGSRKRRGSVVGRVVRTDEELVRERTMLQNFVHGLGGDWESMLLNVHRDVAEQSDKECVIVHGSVVYMHYNMDSVKDVGWGCSYRCLQMIVSNLMLTGVVGPATASSGADTVRMPSHTAIRDAILTSGDRSFLGEDEWIGCVECGAALRQLYDVESRILHHTDTQLAVHGG